jgi:hypothetical protein
LLGDSAHRACIQRELTEGRTQFSFFFS